MVLDAVQISDRAVTLEAQSTVLFACAQQGSLPTPSEKRRNVKLSNNCGTSKSNSSQFREFCFFALSGSIRADPANSCEQKTCRCFLETTTKIPLVERIFIDLLLRSFERTSENASRRLLLSLSNSLQE